MTENQKRKWVTAPTNNKKQRIDNKKGKEKSKEQDTEGENSTGEGTSIELIDRIFRKTAKKRKKMAGKKALKIANLNVRGLKNKSKQQMLLDIFEKEELDILAVAETNLSHAEAKYLYRNDGKIRAWWQGSESRGAGVGLIIKEELAKHTHKIFRISERLLAVKMAFRGSKLTILSVYLPSGKEKKEKTTNEIKAFIQREVKDEEELIVLGDFNAVPNPNLDRKPKKSSRKAEGTIFGILRQRKLKDIIRTVYESKEIYTWKGRGVASRIDAIWGTKRLLTGFQELEIVDTAGYLDTDHQLIILSVETNEALNQVVKVTDKSNFRPFATGKMVPEKWEAFTKD